MLQRKTVEPDTLSLIYDLQAKGYTKDFLLVGGTALALQIGHRTSTDIDLFSIVRFDVESLLIQLQADFEISIRSRMIHALLIDINHIKTDFVFQPSTMIEAFKVIEGVRMASILEIAAMKIGAITSRGRKRDFVDLYCLLNYYSLPEIIKAFVKKYPTATPELAIRSLFYFEDANDDLDPRCFFEYNWDEVKEKIRIEAKKL
jgi:predicted nucleotidyltransferase component of viral defense system